jgi:hypothetical protein
METGKFDRISPLRLGIIIEVYFANHAINIFGMRSVNFFMEHTPNTFQPQNFRFRQSIMVPR